jgi:hypothetical protein
MKVGHWKKNPTISFYRATSAYQEGGMLGWECYCECDSGARPERSKTERGREGPGLALLAGVQTDFLLEREDFVMSMLLRLGKMLRPGNLNVLSLL